MKRKKHLVGLAAAAGTLLLSSASQAAVIVTFDQVGPNVVATWAGSFDPGTWSTDLTSSGFSLGGSSNSLYGDQPFGGGFDLWVFGTASSTTLNSAPNSAIAPVGGSWGFNNNSFYFPAVDNNSEDRGTVDFGSGGSYTMTWSNKTLAGIGAASFNNTLAWTSGAGGTNTISFTTVPEPSAALFGTFSVLGLLLRRRK
jgi:hypothetical protein